MDRGFGQRWARRLQGLSAVVLYDIICPRSSDLVVVLHIYFDANAVWKYVTAVCVMFVPARFFFFVLVSSLGARDRRNRLTNENTPVFLRIDRKSESFRLCFKCVRVSVCVTLLAVRWVTVALASRQPLDSKQLGIFLVVTIFIRQDDCP